MSDGDIIGARAPLPRALPRAAKVPLVTELEQDDPRVQRLLRLANEATLRHRSRGERRPMVEVRHLLGVVLVPAE